MHVPKPQNLQTPAAFLQGQFGHFLKIRGILRLHKHFATPTQPPCKQT